MSLLVSMSGSGEVGLGVGWGRGGYQPGVYMPLKALFLVLILNDSMKIMTRAAS